MEDAVFGWVGVGLYEGDGVLVWGLVDGGVGREEGREGRGKGV